MRWCALGIALVACSEGETIGRSASSLGQPLGSETEPNATAMSATPIGEDAVIRSNVAPGGDADVYRVQGRAGDRVYAATMTSWAADFSDDSRLELLDRDGSTVIELDDDDGSFDDYASSIAGAVLPADGDYYLRVSNASPTQQLRPYDLHLRLQRGTPTAEAEPNDTAAQALGPTGGWIAGALASAADVDVYSVQLGPGDSIFVSLDLDPERDGEWNGMISLQNGLIVAADNGGSSPRSEAAFLTSGGINGPSTYTVAVQSQGGTFGTYRLSVSVRRGVAPSTGPCISYRGTARSIGPGISQNTTSITVPGHPRIADVDLWLRLTHTRFDDLDVRLRSPAGNDVGVFTDIGSPYTAMQAVIDDEASIPIGASGAVSGVALQPDRELRMHWLDGEDGGGDWTLMVGDDTTGEGGTLSEWYLILCERPPELCPDGATPVSIARYDFEAGTDGFTASSVWQRGTPSAAPITTCNGGTGCWKTNLGGPAPASADADLVSPPITLPSGAAPIRLSWAMRYQMETALNDHTRVIVREAGTGANARTVWELFDGTMQAQFVGTTVDMTAGWGTHGFDVSDFAGRTVELVFHFDSNATVNLAGIAIDDVGVTHCSPVCGNGVTQSGEECDEGAANGQPGSCCSASCTTMPAATVCRPAAGLCDVAETCGGASVCPADQLRAFFSICRPSVSNCDVEDFCTGDSPACPDVVRPAGTACRAENGFLSCDRNDVCDGLTSTCADRVLAAGTLCRPARGGCDVEDRCDGVNGDCPEDVVLPAGTPCDDDNPCTQTDRCPGFFPGCEGTDPVVCVPSGPCRQSGCWIANGECLESDLPDGTACADADVCDGDEICTAGACVAGMALDCDDGDACTADSCDALAGCDHTAIACDDGSLCTADACDRTLGCTAAPIACEDGDACTADACDPAMGCTTSAIACDDGDACTADACDPSSGCTYTGSCADASVEPDASVEIDGGVDDGGVDASAAVDASAEDAGRMDAGTGSEDGGCGCRAAPRSDAPLAWLIAVAVLSVRRIRRPRRA